MKLSVGKAAVGGLAIIVAAAVLAGCNGGADDSVPVEPTPATTAPSEAPAQPAPAPNDPFEGRDPVVTNDPGLPGDINSSGAEGSEPEVTYQLMSYSAQAQDYGWWSDEDWCHYFYGTDGVLYGDYCYRYGTDAYGQAVADHFLFYRYDPTQEWNLGAYVMETVARDGYLYVRDLTNPLFNWVDWVASPIGVTPDASNMLYYTDDVAGYSAGWFTGPFLQQAWGLNPAPQPVGGVPSWDPAVTVWSYTTLHNINNQIASIPSWF